MQNPWEYLSDTEPLILSEDREAVENHNRRWAGTPYEILLDEIPSPYIGDPKAPVVLLNLNPGYSAEDKRSPNLARFREVSKANLLHQFYDYPYYVLDPSLEGTLSGYTWFMQKLGPLMRAANITPQELSRKLFTIEYFPYHSAKYGWQGGLLPSQHYALFLLKESMKSGAMIVIMRGRKIWLEAMPELEQYPKVYTLHSVQNVTLSERNLGSEAFAEILGLIKV